MGVDSKGLEIVLSIWMISFEGWSQLTQKSSENALWMFSENYENVRWECSGKVFMESFLKVLWTFVWHFPSQSPGILYRTFITWLLLSQIALVFYKKSALFFTDNAISLVIMKKKIVRYHFLIFFLINFFCPCSLWHKKTKSTIITCPAWDWNHWPLGS